MDAASGSRAMRSCSGRSGETRPASGKKGETEADGGHKCHIWDDPSLNLEICFYLLTTGSVHAVSVHSFWMESGCMSEGVCMLGGGLDTTSCVCTPVSLIVRWR